MDDFCSWSLHGLTPSSASSWFYLILDHLEAFLGFYPKSLKLNRLIKVASNVNCISFAKSLCNRTGFFKCLSPYFLRLSSTTTYTSVPSLNDVPCHLLHPVVLWHLAHCLMIFCASAFLMQLYDIQLEQPSPFIYHSSFQDSSKRQRTDPCNLSIIFSIPRALRELSPFRILGTSLKG